MTKNNTKKSISKNLFPDLALNNIMKKYGAQRVSESARIELRKILEYELIDISKKASQISQHAKRKTINEGDVRIARK